MNEILYILTPAISLGGIGLTSATLLYFVAQRFKLDVDPRIEDVEEILPGANCGGCGSPGCAPFAERLVKSDDISEMFCPVGGNAVMGEIANLLGKTVKEQKPQVAVLLCQGSCDARPKVTNYDGPRSCSIESMIYSGDTGCDFGCLGFGECVDACEFDAMHMDPETNLPVIDSDKCTACNACVKACPKEILELRPKNKRDLKIYVACKNEDKGGIAKKSCSLACIGCSKCEDVCPKGAITVENNLAYIDAETCTLCRKCVDVCPTHSILATNFPEKKVKVTTAKLKVKKTEAKKTTTDKPIEEKIVTAARSVVVAKKPITEIAAVETKPGESQKTVDSKTKN